MVVKCFGIAVASVVLFGTSVQAQDWAAVEEGAVRTAFVENADASIRFSCPGAEATVPSAISLTIGNAAINGPVRFNFDNGTSVAGIFSDGALLADTAERAAVFNLVRDLMKSQNAVTVAARGLTERAFALRGSGRAIGDCPVREATAVAPAPEARPADPVPETPTEAPEVAVVDGTPTPESPPPAAPVPAGSGTFTAPITNDPFADYRLTECSGTRGLLLMNYDTLNGISELSDFCFDPDAGSLDSSEPRADLALSEDSSLGRAYEVLESGTDRYSRVRLDFGQELGCTTQIAENSVNFTIPDGSLVRNPETLFLYARGFTVPDSALTPSDLFDTEIALLSIRDFSVRRIDPATTETALLPEGADLRGVFDANGRSAGFDVTSGNGFWVGDAGGSLSLTVTDSGDVIGSGRFNAKNRRLIGQEDHDWVTMTAEIPYMRGYMIGADGDAVMAYGVVRGSYEDVAGATHQFEASATFTACAEG